MPNTKCPRCDSAGLVRFENVIKAGFAERHYYCGGCDYSWTVERDGTSAADTNKVVKEDRPDRSRSPVR
jgi:transposase-like protein